MKSCLKLSKKCKSLLNDFRLGIEDTDSLLAHTLNAAFACHHLCNRLKLDA